MTSEGAEKRIKKAGFNPKIRAQELSIDNWIKLLTIFPIYGSVRGEKKQNFKIGVPLKGITN